MDATCDTCRNLGRQGDITCVLGHYFPIERAQDFQNLHKVFGIPNLTKIVMSVEEQERPTTIATLIEEARMRMEDKVNGSLGKRNKLQAELANAEQELNYVNEQLRHVREDTTFFAGPSKRDLKGKRKM